MPGTDATKITLSNMFDHLDDSNTFVVLKDKRPFGASTILDGASDGRLKHCSLLVITRRVSNLVAYGIGLPINSACVFLPLTFTHFTNTYLSHIS